MVRYGDEWLESVVLLLMRELGHPYLLYSDHREPFDPTNYRVMEAMRTTMGHHAEFHRRRVESKRFAEQKAEAKS